MTKIFPLVTVKLVICVLSISQSSTAFRCGGITSGNVEFSMRNLGREHRPRYVSALRVTKDVKSSSDKADHENVDNSNNDVRRYDNPSSRRDFFQKATRISSATMISSVSLWSMSTNTKEGNSAWAVDMPDMSKMMPKGLSKQKLSGLSKNIRNVGTTLDELQRDLMQERWDLVEQYPAQLRSYVPLFTTYTDSAFPTDALSDKGLRVALRYEVGRFFASLERLRQATRRQSLDEAYCAYSDMSLHYDRYLHVGGLYPYYDDVISLEPYFQDFNDALVYANPKTDPADVRDLVVLVQGPDKGKTGIVIGVYRDDSNKCVVKLDRFKGMREIKVVSRTWAAKRLGEQAPDDVFLISNSNTR